MRADRRGARRRKRPPAVPRRPRWSRRSERPAASASSGLPRFPLGNTGAPRSEAGLRPGRGASSDAPDLLHRVHFALGVQRDLVDVVVAAVGRLDLRVVVGRRPDLLGVAAVDVERQLLVVDLLRLAGASGQERLDVLGEDVVLGRVALVGAVDPVVRRAVRLGLRGLEAPESRISWTLSFRRPAGRTGGLPQSPPFPSPSTSSVGSPLPASPESDVLEAVADGAAVVPAPPVRPSALGSSGPHAAIPPRAARSAMALRTRRVEVILPFPRMRVLCDVIMIDRRGFLHHGVVEKPIDVPARLPSAAGRRRGQPGARPDCRDRPDRFSVPCTRNTSSAKHQAQSSSEASERTTGCPLRTSPAAPAPRRSPTSPTATSGTSTTRAAGQPGRPTAPGGVPAGRRAHRARDHRRHACPGPAPVRLQCPLRHARGRAVRRVHAAGHRVHGRPPGRRVPAAPDGHLTGPHDHPARAIPEVTVPA